MSKNINETINLNELVVTPQGASFSSNKTGVQPTTTKYWRIKVKPGDNLTKLANQYNTTVDELVKINNLKDPNSIYAGLDLRVVSREKENKNYASDYIQAVKNIAEVRKIDTRHAAALLDELISQGAVKFDGTP
ncbi:MAG: LysM peptidoglycan-binding domain-containing protein [Bacilli bacterium]|nr:LysM peptidoglycan-binding domain-containing protein [Bacilli bacterium]